MRKFLSSSPGKAPEQVKNAFSHTFGALDDISVDGPLARASGWGVGLEGGSTDLVLKCDDLPLPIESIEIGLPSPDVQQAWPQLQGSAACRFRLTAKLTSSLVQADGGNLFSVVPFAGCESGVPLERVVPLQVAVPTAEQALTVGHGDFVETSFSMLSLFRLVANLKKDARVLDPGCGIGRIAYALCHYLSPVGRYAGFDVSQEAIAVAKTIFAGKSNFSFSHADLRNAMYNPGGHIASDQFRFPFADKTFDFTVMTSVFTHLLPGEVRNYLAEIARTLAGDGSCFATFFVLDELAKANIQSGAATLNISHPYAPGCFVQNPAVPENAVAYDAVTLAAMISAAGLAIEEVHWGQWPGRSVFLSYQDIYLLKKKAAG